MLDLNKLEQLLDDALALETPESLNQWLDSQRMKKIEFFIGESVIECLSNRIDGHCLAEANIFHSSINENIPSVPDNNYQFAA